METFDKPLWQSEDETLTLEMDEVVSRIIVYNDDVNTFDWVIKSFVEILDHTPEQAEQCSLIIHYKGKCIVKTGSLDDLEPMCSALLNRQLSAELITESQSA